MKILIAVLIALCGLTVSAAPQQLSAEDSSIINEWFDGPDRTDYKWKVNVWKPSLTYQQRYGLVVSAKVDGSILRKKPGKTVTFVMRLADANGKWYPGEDRAEYVVPTNSPRPIDFISLRCGAYLLPGDYRVAVLMYDPSDQTGNVRHTTVHVPGLDTLPEIARDLPKVEFPSRAPGMSDGPLNRDPGWSLATGVENLPIATAKPLRIEVLLDFSELDEWYYSFWMSPTQRGAYAELQYAYNLMRILRVGSVLSHVRPSAGCVRVSAVDMTRMRVLADRQNATTLDWKKLEETLFKIDHARIDAATLTRQSQRSLFVNEFLTRIATDNQGCAASPAQDAAPVVIVVSPDLVNPRDVPYAPLNPETCGNCRFYYLRMAFFGSDPRDPYAKILAPAHPRKMRFDSPLEFRKVLDKLIRELEAPS